MSSRFRFYYDDGTSLEPLGSFLAGLEWTFFDVTGYLDPGKVLVAFGIFGNGAGCHQGTCTRTLVDDVRIAVPEPAVSTLLAIGLAWLARGRRNRRGVRGC